MGFVRRMGGFVYYGDKRVEVELPNGWNSVSVPGFREVQPLDGVEKAIAETVASAVKRRPPRGKVVILSDDKTRRTPAYKVLPPLLDELQKSGVKDQDITLIAAPGSHSEMTAKDMERKAGSEVLERIEFKNHDYESPNLVNVGKTNRGTPICIDNDVANSDTRIGIGSVFPHALAGFSGGGKIVIPGVAGRETLGFNHSLVTDPDFRFEYTANNPIFKDIREAAEKVRLDIKIDMVLTPPPREEIVAIHAGDFKQAQDRAIEVCESVYSVMVPKLVDVAVVSTHPFDRFLAEALKAVSSGNSITKHGGTIVVSCPLHDGIHSNRKVEELTWQMMVESLDNMMEVVEKIRQGVYEATVPYRFRRIQEKKDIIFATDGVSERKMSEMGLISAKSLDEALQMAAKKHRTADVAILPLGGETIPRVGLKQ